MPLKISSSAIWSIVNFCFFSGLSFWTIMLIARKLNPINKGQKPATEEKGKSKLAKIGKKELTLSDHEILLCSSLIPLMDFDTSFKDIAGMDDTLNELYETFIFPIKWGKRIKSRLTRAPRGVLLYGPPGCGKTLIAKAAVKEAGIAFLCLDISILTDKWYGESQKMTSALFSLAEKLEPCIIFIDEIDSLLRKRSDTDHEVTAGMKALFLNKWDGFATDNDKIIVIMGATNRPHDVDDAILRRMPTKFLIDKPNHESRVDILKHMLKQEDVSECVDYDELASLTEGYVGSSLKELCRIASSYRVREIAQMSSTGDELDALKLRQITMEDLVKAFESMLSSAIA